MVSLTGNALLPHPEHKARTVSLMIKNQGETGDKGIFFLVKQIELAGNLLFQSGNIKAGDKFRDSGSSTKQAGFKSSQDIGRPHSYDCGTILPTSITFTGCLTLQDWRQFEFFCALCNFPEDTALRRVSAFSPSSRAISWIDSSGSSMD